MIPMKWSRKRTEYIRERETWFNRLREVGGTHQGRRDFLKMAALSAGVASGLSFVPHSFSLVDVAEAGPQRPGYEPFTFAYISDSHLYEKELNERFVRQLQRAIDDVNALDPQPDFILYGGDLAQLGQRRELALGAELLDQLHAPVRMMVGEHDWFLDMGEYWQELFGEPQYSFDHKGVHFVTLMSVNEADFWTSMGLMPMERMQIVAGLDDGRQSRFEVGEAGREWLSVDLANVSTDTPIVVFSHSPLYKYYRNWNFWTEDAEQVQEILRPFRSVSVIHGHTHQMLSNRIGNIHFHGMLSTAWPWPYAPSGLPRLTVEMSRPDPFLQTDGLGSGTVDMNAVGYADKHYDFFNRNPLTVSSQYLSSDGLEDRPPQPPFASY